MAKRAQRLENEYLKNMYSLSKTTHYKKMKIGTMSLAAFVRALVDETPSMSLKTAKELYEIADELEELH